MDDPAWILLAIWLGTGTIVGLIVLLVGWVKSPPRKGQWIQPADPGRPPFWMPPVPASPIIAKALIAGLLGMFFVPVVLLFGFAGAAKNTNRRPAARW